MTEIRQDLKSKIKARAQSLGFPLCRVTTVDPPAQYQRYADWLTKGHHAGMAYMDSERHRKGRIDPRQLFHPAQAILVLALPYRLTTQQEMTQREAALICGYALDEDYHLSIPSKLEPLLDMLQEHSPTGLRPRVFTDSAPVLERELAARSGMGWIGRNSCLISPQIGSAFLLAEVFTDIALDPDDLEQPDLCGTCDRCIKACPTGCILPDRTIDAGRCISYHSIENRAKIPVVVMEKFTNQAFGCDICQTVCPWNRFAAPSAEDAVVENLIHFDELVQMIHMSQDEFDLRFGETAVSRVRHTGFIRNLIIAQRNLDPGFSKSQLEVFLEPEPDEILRYTAYWVLDKTPY